ncbi:MAG: hypothetical protein RIC30_17705 [Marinoscillum sp.]|uniref:hypothetical protein n=1 Tax=Marinoscillum sp. TaxID=2024838 RepID=UPI0032FA57FE
MFLQILDLVIGLIFIYFILSIAASSIMETISRTQNVRAKSLQKWLTDSFNEKVGDKKVGELIHEHSLIKKLTTSGRIPSYIPPDIFSRVLLDLIHSQEDKEIKSYDAKGLKKSLESTTLLPEDMKRSFLQYLSENEKDLDAFRASISGWFDDSMSRIGGKFKKYTQKIILGVSLVLAGVLNIDTFQLAEFLYENPQARESLVEASRQALQDSVYQKSLARIPTDSGYDVAVEIARIKTQVNEIDSLQRSLIDLKLPIGWPVKKAVLTSLPSFSTFWDFVGAWLKKIGGWLITGFAVSLGAPFWFETLNKLVNLRGAGSNPSVPPKPAKS